MGDDYAEAAWQRKLRNQANRKDEGEEYNPFHQQTILESAERRIFH